MKKGFCITKEKGKKKERNEKYMEEEEENELEDKSRECWKLLLTDVHNSSDSFLQSFSSWLFSLIKIIHKL